MVSRADHQRNRYGPRTLRHTAARDAPPTQHRLARPHGRVCLGVVPQIINQVPDAFPTLVTRIASGDVPDLVNLNNETALTYYQQGALEPLDLYLKPADKNEYIPALWNKTIFDHKFNYAFPWYASPQVMFINEDIFAKAGLDPNKPPKTWEDMYNYSKIIKSKTGVYGFTMEFANIAQYPS